MMMSDLPMNAEARHILTVGHSNQSLDSFLKLIERHAVEAVIDTRSYPVSRFAPHFNRPCVEAALEDRGIKYRFWGPELGGRPQGHEFYDEEGRVLYWRVAEAPLFLRGIEKVLRGLAKHRVVLLCSEENPAGCHRRLLIGRVLASRGVVVEHIRGSGRIERETAWLPGNEQSSRLQEQLSLFSERPAVSEDKEWKSVQSVLRRNRPLTSSTH